MTRDKKNSLQSLFQFPNFGCMKGNLRVLNNNLKNTFQYGKVLEKGNFNFRFPLTIFKIKFNRTANQSEKFGQEKQLNWLLIGLLIVYQEMLPKSNKINSFQWQIVHKTICLKLV